MPSTPLASFQAERPSTHNRPRDLLEGTKEIDPQARAMKTKVQVSRT